MFRGKAVGDYIEFYFEELKKKLKFRFNLLKNENEKESYRACSQFIMHEFIAIERKLKMNEYKQFSDFERDLKLFFTFFMENGPKTVNKKLIINDFLEKAAIEGGN